MAGFVAPLRRWERLIRVKVFAYDDSVDGFGGMRRVWMEEAARPKRVDRKMPRQAWTAEQEAKLKQAVSEGRFQTAGQAVRWWAEAFYWFRRCGYRKKVPRPLARKADVQAQEVWKEAFRKHSVRKVRGEERR